MPVDFWGMFYSRRYKTSPKSKSRWRLVKNKPHSSHSWLRYLIDRIPSRKKLNFVEVGIPLCKWGPDRVHYLLIAITWCNLEQKKVSLSLMISIMTRYNTIHRIYKQSYRYVFWCYRWKPRGNEKHTEINVTDVYCLTSFGSTVPSCCMKWHLEWLYAPLCCLAECEQTAAA